MKEAEFSQRISAVPLLLSFSAVKKIPVVPGFHILSQLLEPKDISEDQRRYYRSITFYNELRRFDIELTPGDLFIRHSA